MSIPFSSPAEGIYLQTRKNGYRRLAEFMTFDSGNEVFARFRTANNINLLLLQAEVAELEKEVIDWNLYNAEDWCNLMSLRDAEQNKEKWARFKILRAKLAEYSM
jgi:hypothetical protein